MRLASAQPETKRLSNRLLIQEGGEVAGVIRIADSLVGRLERPLVVRVAGWILFLEPGGTVALIKSWAPAFAGEAHEISLLFQQVGKEQPAIGENGIMIAGLAQLPGIATGQQARAGRRTLRVAIERVGEQNAFLGNPIKIGSSHIGRTVYAHAVPRSVVGDNEEKIGPVFRRHWSRCKDQQQHSDRQQLFFHRCETDCMVRQYKEVMDVRPAIVQGRKRRRHLCAACSIVEPRVPLPIQTPATTR